MASGRSPEEGNDNPLQSSYLENPVDGRGYSLWDHKESDRTEQLTHTHTHTHTSCGGVNYVQV